MENAEDEGEGVGEKEEQWLAVEMAEAGGELRELLSTVLYFCSSSSNSGECKKTKEKGKGKRSGWRWKRRRLVVSCSPLFACNVNSRECKRRRKGE
jgi:hypothetical protein